MNAFQLQSYCPSCGIFILLLLSGCDSASTVDSTTQESAEVESPVASRDLKSVFGNEDAITLLRTASQTEAYRLPPDMGRKLRIDQFEMSSGPIVVQEELSNELRDVLLDESSYGWDIGPKGCIPAYGVRVSYLDASNTVDILFCFDCEILLTYSNGRLAGSHHFDPGCDRFVAIVKQIFPDDPAIQALPN